MAQPLSTSPIKVLAYDHIKVAIAEIPKFEKTLQVLGFVRADAAPDFIGNPDSIWASGEAVFCIYKPSHPLAKKHFDLHGDTVFDLSFMVEEGSAAPQELPGVGGMKHTLVSTRSFKRFPSARGIEKFDHNTINIEMGQLNQTVCDYLSKFVLERGQFFDIKTKLTGLKSWVTRSPNLGVQIPFNEASDPKSQIQEYIEIHKGPGVQHIALLTKNIIETMTEVAKDSATNFEFLSVPDTYYELAQKRVKIRENIKDLEKLRILVDQDKVGGYLLQIFTQNLFGGFFFELIQREGNIGFGEGNFQALFESIELDQQRRGVL
jgi:4-hydroxyphenylpyruvate dioxygenase-like putative hemolysin